MAARSSGPRGTRACRAGAAGPPGRVVADPVGVPAPQRGEPRVEPGRRRARSARTRISAGSTRGQPAAAPRRAAAAQAAAGTSAWATCPRACTPASVRPATVSRGGLGQPQHPAERLGQHALDRPPPGLAPPSRKTPPRRRRDQPGAGRAVVRPATPTSRGPRLQRGSGISRSASRALPVWFVLVSCRLGGGVVGLVGSRTVAPRRRRSASSASCRLVGPTARRHRLTRQARPGACRRPRPPRSAASAAVGGGAAAGGRGLGDGGPGGGAWLATGSPRTSSMTAIGALSPLRGPILVIRV